MPTVPIPTTHGFIDLTNKTFGRLVVESYAGRVSGQTSWNCRCVCGTKKVVHGQDLREEKTKSCGCWKADLGAARLTKHNGSQTPEFRAWSAMLTRCYNKNSTDYEDYGGRGIQVCEEWRRSFQQFLDDMGPKPSVHHTVDRRNNDKGYNPENCRWATRKEQGNNKRNNRIIEYNGRRLTLSQWAEETGLTYSALQYRLDKGWSIDAALTTPTLHTYNTLLEKQYAAQLMAAQQKEEA
jgi:hypothetical protein